MLDVPTRSEALLGLLLQICFVIAQLVIALGGHSGRWQGLQYCGVWGLAEHAEGSTETKTLEFRRAHSELSWEVSMEGREASACWEFFKNFFPGSTKAVHALQR